MVQYDLESVEFQKHYIQDIFYDQYSKKHKKLYKIILKIILKIQQQNYKYSYYLS